MISSLSNSRVRQVVQWQSKARERNRDGVFVAEGMKMYQEAPEELIREVYVSEEFLRRSEQAQTPSLYADVRDKLARTGYQEVSEEVFAKMSDTRTPQGILIVANQPQYDLEPLLRRENPLFLILDNLQDPGNLGTVIRTGEGAGITGVIMSADTVDVFNPKVIRSTMGSVYRVPFLYADSLPAVMERLHNQKVKTYAAHLQGEVYYEGISFCGPTAFLIGNEGNGLRDEVAGAASMRLKIPMEGRVESLNAGVAAALLMYEAHRQRRRSQGIS